VATLYLFCGLPGSGKSTVARVLADDEGAVRLAPEEWLDSLALDLTAVDERERIRRLQWEHAQVLLARDVSVILEFGFATRAERDEKRVHARSLGASVELWFLDDDLELLWSRVERRNVAGAPGAAPVARADFDAWVAAFERPDAEELALYDTPEDQPAAR
jgi:predicted kinase